MGLLVDACLTSDGEIVLWHDWSPDDFTGLRQLGVGDLGVYRPWVPDAGEILRRDTIDLTLAQFRLAFGYVPIGARIRPSPHRSSFPRCRTCSTPRADGPDSGTCCSTSGCRPSRRSDTPRR